MKKQFNQRRLGKPLLKFDLKMKLTTLLLSLTLFGLYANDSYAQKTKVTLDIKNATILTIIDEIESVTDFRFIYKTKDVDLERKLSLKVNKENIEKILKRLFDNTTTIYKLRGTQIILKRNLNPIKPKTVPKQTYQDIEQDQIEVIGQVTDENGIPLPGTSIVEKGTNNGVSADLDGNFSIEVTNEQAVLVISYIGFSTQEVTVSAQVPMKIVLKEDTAALGEVVVVGYGTQKKVNLTGEVAVIGGEQLDNGVPTSTTALMQGQASGVFVTEGSGLPGNTNIRILIRGLGTMNNNNPLVLIDGIESSMDNINPNDIESINILKDASSSSIYGTRAANGVVLITTKRGKSGEYLVSYHTAIGEERPINLPQKLDSWNHALLVNEANANDGVSPTYSDADIQKYRDGSDPYRYPNSKWIEELLRTGSGLIKRHNLAISGGSEMSKVFLSLESFNQEGQVSNVEYQRYNLRLNLDTKINNWLAVGLNSSYLPTKINEPTNPFSGGFNQIYRQVNMIPSTEPIRDENGEYVPWTNGNPLAWVENGGSNTRKSYNAVGSLFGEITFMKGLVLRGQLGVNYNLDDNKYHVKSFDYANGASQGPNSVEDRLIRQNHITLTSLLTYTKSFKDHNFKGLLGASREHITFNQDVLRRTNFPSNDLDQIDAGAVGTQTNSGFNTESKIGSYFGRLNYDYKGRYLLEANLRHDGSSKFGQGYRWGTFPSFSAGWRLSEEEFMNNISWIEELKLKGSWGKLGNHRIDDYLFVARIATGQDYSFFGEQQSGAAQIVANTPDITWETTEEYNIGLDASFFKNKLSASFGYYNRLTDDILTSIPVNIVFGLPSPVANVGSMRNKGVEFNLTHMNTLGDFKYEIAGNMSINENVVEKFDLPELGNNIRREGDSWNAYFGYEAIGIYQSDEEAANSPHIMGAPVKAGDLIFKDQDGDGDVDSDDRIVLGNQIPRITYGINLNLGWRNLDMSMLFQGVADAHNTVGNELWPFVSGGSAYTRHLDRTIVENGRVVEQGLFPRLGIDLYRQHNATFSSFQVLKSDYLRLKNLQFGYTLPSKYTERFKVSRLRFSFSGKNLFTFTKFLKDFDPELNGAGAWTYPQTQIYMFGINVEF